MKPGGAACRSRDRARQLVEGTPDGGPLCPGDARTLVLLAQLSLAPVDVLTPFAGLDSVSTLYTRIARLTEFGMLAAVRPARWPQVTGRLIYPTDRAIESLAVAWNDDVRALARRLRLRGGDLVLRVV